MSRYMPAGGGVVIGPGPMTPAVRALVYLNAGVFFVSFVLAMSGNETILTFLGLKPQLIFEQFYIWTPVTYLFLHDPTGFGHILFNMLALWMFGVDLERRWGTRAFLRYYFVTGIGAGVGTVLVSLLPFEATRGTYYATTVGASGAIYGLLLAWALLFPARQILFMFIFPLPARVAALLMAGMAFLSAASGRNGSV
ncbi:MAG TPA: rhomboid family intramembrane serine protease, partial [Vicinamibacterales bacterium]|nr:rhomboid family intramembrane serine protease [Vicinamibacterales bacterium]